MREPRGDVLVSRNRNVPGLETGGAWASLQPRLVAPKNQVDDQNEERRPVESGKNLPVKRRRVADSDKENFLRSWGLDSCDQKEAFESNRPFKFLFGRKPGQALGSGNSGEFKRRRIESPLQLNGSSKMSRSVHPFYLRDLEDVHPLSRSAVEKRAMITSEGMRWTRVVSTRTFNEVSAVVSKGWTPDKYQIAISQASIPYQDLSQVRSNLSHRFESSVGDTVMDIGAPVAGSQTSDTDSPSSDSDISLSIQKKPIDEEKLRERGFYIVDEKENGNITFLAGPVLCVESKGKKRYVALYGDLKPNEETFRRLSRAAGRLSINKKKYLSSDAFFTPLKVNKKSSRVEQAISRGECNRQQGRRGFKHQFNVKKSTTVYVMEQLGLTKETILELDRRGEFFDNVLLSNLENMSENTFLNVELNKFFEKEDVENFIKERVGKSVEELSAVDKKLVVLFLRQTYEVLHKIAHSLSKEDTTDNSFFHSRLVNSSMGIAEGIESHYNKRHKLMLTTSIVYANRRDKPHKLSHIARDAVIMEMKIKDSDVTFRFIIPVDSVLRPCLPAGFAHSMLRAFMQPYIDEIEKQQREDNKSIFSLR